MKRFLWTSLSLLLLAGMGYSLVNLVTRDAPTTPRPPDKVLAERVIVAPADSPTAGPDLRDPVVTSGAYTSSKALVGGNGVVEPDGEEVAVAGPVAGRVAAVLVTEGQRIAAGAPLVELESALEKAAVAIAEAEVEVARSRLELVLAGSRTEDVRRASAEAREAASRAELSKGVLARLEKAAAGGAATPDELDRARRQAEADRYAANAAAARRQVVVNGSREEEVKAARADVAVAEARLTEAQARLAQRVITAPRAAEVLQVKLRPGAYYQPGGEAVVLGDTSRLFVRVDVDERDFSRVVTGAPVKVMAKAFGERVFTGKVHELGRRMGRKNVRTDDPTELNDTKILEVLVALDDAAGLVVGQRVTALITAQAEAGSH